MRRSGGLLAVAVVGLCAACVDEGASPYEANYKPLPTPTAVQRYTGEPQLRASLGSASADTLAMFTLGYANVGWASFRGGPGDPEDALVQARSIGAAYVIISQDYVGDGRMAVPGGPVNPSGLDTRASGAVLVHNDPTRLYAQAALFFAPLPREGAGIFYGDAGGPAPRSGVVIAAVRQGSPAAAAGIAPGDIMEAVDGRPTPTAASVHALGPLRSTACLRVRRGSQERDLCLVTPAGWR